MNIYRPTFKDRTTGKRKLCPRHYLDFRDHLRQRQRFRAFESKDETEALARIVSDLVVSRNRGQKPEEATHRALQTLPEQVQRRLVDLDLCEPSWLSGFAAEHDRLSVWIDEFEDWLKTSRGKSGYKRNAIHVSVTMHRIRSIAAGCGFKTWGDITKSKVENYLGTLEVALSTHNGYVTAWKHFCTWVVRDGRAEFSPCQFLDRVTVSHKETRRPLAADEVAKLLAATVNSRRRYCLSGFDRAVLYRVAIETGFRRNELRHLTTESFELDKGVVHLAAQHCKDRRDCRQPITLALASRLQAYLTDKEPTEPVWAFRTPKTALMIQRDATAAGLSIMDAEGRELVFHSTRHTLRTELVCQGSGKPSQWDRVENQPL